MVVLVEYAVGELGRVRGGPGRREGECRPGCEPAAVSEISAKEGCGRRRSGGPLHADPITRSQTSLKRARNQEQGKKCPEAGEATPLTPRISRSMNVASTFHPVDLELQTPMPESDAGSGYGPPPPNTTPTPLREYTSGDAPLHSPYCEVVAAWIV